MITPNKAVSIEESALGMTPAILRRGPEPIDLLSLYEVVHSEFDSIDQFLLALDVLYVIGSVDLDFATRLVTYAE